ncbi:MAG: phosphoglycerate mutase family protein [Chitinophagaceae bacterium]
MVRHADRLDDSGNSPLSEVGFVRAGTLRDSLIGKRIDYLFASTFLRTQQTANPLAESLNKPVQIYNKDTTNKLIAALQRINGKKVLIVGHSDNVPAIVLGLSGQSVPVIGHDEFDNLYVIRIRKFITASKRLWHKTYGIPSP